MTLKRKGSQGDYPGRHMTGQASTSLMNTRAVTLTTFPFQCMLFTVRWCGRRHEVIRWGRCDFIGPMIVLYSWGRKIIYFSTHPANTQRNKHVIITSKRRFDVIITCLLRCVFAGQYHYIEICWTHQSLKLLKNMFLCFRNSFPDWNVWIVILWASHIYFSQGSI